MPHTPKPSSPLREFPTHLRTLHRYVGHRMYWVFALGLLAAIAESAGIMMILPLLYSLDPNLSDDVPGGVAGIASNTLSAVGLSDSVGVILLIIVAFIALKGALLFGASAYKAYLNGQLMQELKTRMYDAYGEMRLQYYLSRNTGHFVNVINQQTAGFQFFFEATISLGISLMKTLTYTAIAVAVAWRFGLIAVGMGVVLYFSFLKLNLLVRRLSQKSVREEGHLEKLLIQSIQAFKYLSSTSRYSRLRAAVSESIAHLRRYIILSGLAQAFTASVREPIIVAALVMVVVVQVLWLAQPLGPILVSILLLYRGLGEILSTQAAWQRVLAHIGSLELVGEEFDRLSQEREPDGTHALGELKHGIEFENVWFSYEGSQTSVLRGISLTIPHRRSVAIVGESGSGKSTLVDLLTLMLRPTSGRVLIDGVPGNDLALSAWRRQIGFVSQDTVLFDDTIANNICLWQGNVDTDAELFARVREAARQAHIDQVIEKLPAGYHTEVGERGMRLSGGQRQRLFIARELFKRPQLLILDEATSALDSESELAIKASIDALKGSTTIVMIAHRLSTIRDVDQVYVLDKGVIIEQGTYEALREDPRSRLSRLIAAQAL
jgi:ABC-type multidrug transport system fused ATPase/permease subunit